MIRPYATHVPLFEESFTKEELEKTTQVNAVPDPKAPRGLDLEELELVLKDEQCATASVNHPVTPN
jgi:hypothetical protein